MNTDSNKTTGNVLRALCRIVPRRDLHQFLRFASNFRLTADDMKTIIRNKRK